MNAKVDAAESSEGAVLLHDDNDVLYLWMPPGMEWSRAPPGSRLLPESLLEPPEPAMLPCAGRLVSPPQEAEITTRRSSRATTANLEGTQVERPPVDLAARVGHLEPDTVSPFPLETQHLCFALAP